LGRFSASISSSEDESKLARFLDKAMVLEWVNQSFSRTRLYTSCVLVSFQLKRLRYPTPKTIKVALVKVTATQNMAYHITKVSYDKIECDLRLFLERLSQLDFNTLVTEEDFAKYEANNSRLTNAYEYDWYPTINRELLYRQLQPGELYHQLRLLVTFSSEPSEKHFEILRSRGFQVADTVIKNWCGSMPMHLIIIAEERVDLDDALEWAKKFDYRENVSVLTPPVCFPPTLEIDSYTMYPERDSCDTKEFMEFALVHGLKKATQRYGSNSWENDVMKVLTRAKNIKNNEVFEF